MIDHVCRTPEVERIDALNRVFANWWMLRCAAEVLGAFGILWLLAEWAGE